MRLRHAPRYSLKTFRTITTTTVADGENRELRSVIDRANIGNIFECALEHRATTGPEAELQAHFHLAANVIPLTMLETRAVTPAPGQVAQNQSAIIPGVFPMSCAAIFVVSTCQPSQLVMLFIRC